MNAVTLMLLSLLAEPGSEGLQHACGQLAEVPAVSVNFAAPAASTRLQRRHDLMRRFSEGDGELVRSGTDADALALSEGTALYPLPWEIHPERRDRSRLLVWQDRERVNDENMRSLVLRSNESWCTGELDWNDGARLRFEAVSIEQGRPATLELTGARLPFPDSLNAERQTDLALPGTSGNVCFRVTRGAAAIGEARILEPDPGHDPRPRWLVLTMVDSLRGDVLRTETSSRIMPTLDRLGGSGHFYERAVSPGCHTRASVWPTLMGRDLMRVDPIRRRQSMPVESPLPTVYSRANVFISHAAQSAGYHPVFLGNHPYLRVIPAFSRFSRWGHTDRGTIDVVQALPELMARYADERVLLVYYPSAPHGHYRTPKRLFEALGCDELAGMEQCRCAYRARALHADESIRALQSALRAYGLDDDTVQIVTADHGELLGDGMKIEGEMPTFTTGVRRGAFQSFESGHGNSCHAIETDVPLVMHGPGLEPGRWEAAVSGLDIFPTMLELMEMPVFSKLDGNVLPLFGSSSRRGGPFVSYGFCSDSVFEGEHQLIWWIQGCRLRKLGDQSPIVDEAEMWSRAERRPLSVGRAELRDAMRGHESWIRERLASDALVLDTANLDAPTIIVDVLEGHISDYGPAGTVYGLDGIREVRLSPDRRRLTVSFDGYRGLYHVSTRPSNAPVEIRVEGVPDALVFAGPMQLPFPTHTIDPSRRPGFFFSSGTPARRETPRPAIRLWWHRFRPDGSGDPH